MPARVSLPHPTLPEQCWSLECEPRLLSHLPSSLGGILLQVFGNHRLTWIQYQKSKPLDMGAM